MKEFQNKKNSDVIVRVPIRRKKESSRCSLFMNIPEPGSKGYSLTLPYSESAKMSAMRLVRGLERLVIEEVQNPIELFKPKDYLKFASSRADGKIIIAGEEAIKIEKEQVYKESKIPQNYKK